MENSNLTDSPSKTDSIDINNVTVEPTKWYHGKYQKDYDLYLYVELTVYNYGMFVFPCIGILTNLLVIITTSSDKRLYRPSAGILMIMSASVDCLLMTCQIVHHINHDRTIRIFKPYCFVNTYLMYILKSLSKLIKLLISVNHYALVCHPMTHQKITSRKSTLIWLGIITLTCFLTSIYVLFSIDPKSNYCRVGINSTVEVWVYSTGTVAVYIIFSNIFPLVVTTALSIFVIQGAKYKERCGGTAEHTAAYRLAERQVTKALVATNVAWVLLTLPYFIAYILHTLFYFEVKLPAITYNTIFITHRILKLFYCLNFFMNLFFYIWFSALFRVALVNLFTRKQRRKAQYSTVTQEETV